MKVTKISNGYIIQNAKSQYIFAIALYSLLILFFPLFFSGERLIKVKSSNGFIPFVAIIILATIFLIKEVFTSIQMITMKHIIILNEKKRKIYYNGSPFCNFESIGNLEKVYVPRGRSGYYKLVLEDNNNQELIVLKQGSGREVEEVYKVIKNSIARGEYEKNI